MTDNEWPTWGAICTKGRKEIGHILTPGNLPACDALVRDIAQMQLEDIVVGDASDEASSAFMLRVIIKRAREILEAAK